MLTVQLYSNIYDVDISCHPKSRQCFFAIKINAYTKSSNDIRFTMVNILILLCFVIFITQGKNKREKERRMRKRDRRIRKRNRERFSGESEIKFL